MLSPIAHVNHQYPDLNNKVRQYLYKQSSSLLESRVLIFLGNVNSNGTLLASIVSGVCFMYMTGNGRWVQRVKK